jgi:hypothetical protein
MDDPISTTPDHPPAEVTVRIDEEPPGEPLLTRAEAGAARLCDVAETLAPGPKPIEAATESDPVRKALDALVGGLSDWMEYTAKRAQVDANIARIKGNEALLKTRLAAQSEDTSPFELTWTREFQERVRHETPRREQLEAQRREYEEVTPKLVEAERTIWRFARRHDIDATPLKRLLELKDLTAAEDAALVLSKAIDVVGDDEAGNAYNEPSVALQTQTPRQSTMRVPLDAAVQAAFDHSAQEHQRIREAEQRKLQLHAVGERLRSALTAIERHAVNIVAGDDAGKITELAAGWTPPLMALGQVLREEGLTDLVDGLKTEGEGARTIVVAIYKTTVQDNAGRVEELLAKGFRFPKMLPRMNEFLRRDITQEIWRAWIAKSETKRATSSPAKDPDPRAKVGTADADSWDGAIRASRDAILEEARQREQQRHEQQQRQERFEAARDRVRTAFRTEGTTQQAAALVALGEVLREQGLDAYLNQVEAMQYEGGVMLPEPIWLSVLKLACRIIRQAIAGDHENVSRLLEEWLGDEVLGSPLADWLKHSRIVDALGSFQRKDHQNQPADTPGASEPASSPTTNANTLGEPHPPEDVEGQKEGGDPTASAQTSPATTPASKANRTRKQRRRITKQAMAIGILYEKKQEVASWSDGRLAEALDCHVKSIPRWTVFKQLRELVRQGRPLPRRHKDGPDSVEDNKEEGDG